MSPGRDGVLPRGVQGLRKEPEEQIPRGLKSLCENSAVPGGLESLSHCTQHSALPPQPAHGAVRRPRFGYVLAIMSPPLRGWFSNHLYHRCDPNVSSHTDSEAPEG